MATHFIAPSDATSSSVRAGAPSYPTIAHRLTVSSEPGHAWRMRSCWLFLITLGMGGELGCRAESEASDQSPALAPAEHSTPGEAAPTELPAATEPTARAPEQPTPSTPPPSISPPWPDEPSDPAWLEPGTLGLEDERVRAAKSKKTLPRACEVETQIIKAKPTPREDTCKGLDVIGCDTVNQSWFDVIEQFEVALLMPQPGNELLLLRELAVNMEGTEEKSTMSAWFVYRTAPLDAWLLMLEGSERCDDNYLCGLHNTHHLHVVVTSLGGDRYLVTRVRVDNAHELDRAAQLSGNLDGVPAARVVVDGDEADVWVCGGHVRVALPTRPSNDTSTLTPPTEPTEPSATPPASPASAAELEAARKRCNEGWSKFKADDLAGAELDIDAALTVLERGGESETKGLGACLYNRGRIAEEKGDESGARELYRRSLAIRPNETVQARLDALD